MAPRPQPGEAVSSWVRRVGARYDISGDDLVEHVLDRPGRAIGVASTLDYRAVPDVEAALANASRMSATKISGLRIAGDDGSSSCWHRSVSAWCRLCLRADLAVHGELYERAIWRLGFCVVCSEHNVPLEDTCGFCLSEARCRFVCSGGLLGLACDTCNRPQGREPRRRRDRWHDEDERAGAFGICVTPSLNRLTGSLQSDLRAALTGLQPRRSWGLLRSPKDLVTAVLDVTCCLIMATRVRCEPRIILPVVMPGEAFAPAPEPITPAALPTRAAHGVLAISAAVLHSLGGGGEGHMWRPDGGKSPLTVSSFLAWLPADIRSKLKSWSTGWEGPAGQVLQATIAAVEATR